MGYVSRGTFINWPLPRQKKSRHPTKLKWSGRLNLLVHHGLACQAAKVTNYAHTWAKSTRPGKLGREWEVSTAWQRIAIYDGRVAGYGMLSRSMMRYRHEGSRGVLSLSRIKLFFSSGRWALLWGVHISKKWNNGGISPNLAQFGFGYVPKNLEETRYDVNVLFMPCN